MNSENQKQANAAVDSALIRSSAQQLSQLQKDFGPPQGGLKNTELVLMLRSAAYHNPHNCILQELMTLAANRIEFQQERLLQLQDLENKILFELYRAEQEHASEAGQLTNSSSETLESVLNQPIMSRRTHDNT